ncbi:MAG: putative molybdenum carrier protein [Desulfobacterales bacterium]
MIQKIISGGYTSADRAALDAAIKLGISYGGWIPKGRTAETGTLPETYDLQEIPTDNYTECIRQNVKDSKGTLIIFYGKLSGDLYQAERETLRQKHQLLGIDLKQKNAFQGASLLNDWVQLRQIDVLYVIGASAILNPNIENHTRVMIERALILDLMNVPVGRVITDYSKKDYYIEKQTVLPKTIHEAVERLILELSLKDKVVIANMTYDELADLNSNLGAYIRNAFRLWSGNAELMESCRFAAKDKTLNVDSASFAIIDNLWEKLRKTHKLKVIK